MNRLRKIILAVLLLLSLTATAQTEYVFKTLDARNGLTSSQVNCILKDTRGYMWFGTPAGLYRYDGYVFRHFQSDSQDGSSLPDSYIVSIKEMLNGNLWVQTAMGYCIYDPVSESFERDMKSTFEKFGQKKEIPRIVTIDRHHNLWGFIPSRGVFCYNMQQQLTYEYGYTEDENGIPQGNICSFGECKDGVVLVYDDGRLVCCDVTHQQQVLWMTNDIAKMKLRNSNTLRVFADQVDNIWLYGQGTLFRYEKRAHTWDTTIGDQLGLTGSSVENAINSMGGDSQGNIWLGTNSHGLIRMNVNTLQMEPVPLSTMRINRLRANSCIRSIYIDDSNLLWVGTDRSGVVYYGSNIYKFDIAKNGEITAMAQDSLGNIWYGTGNNGIDGFDGQLASQKVTAIACTKDGSIWVGSQQSGLTRIINGETIIYTESKEKTGRTLIDNHINALAVDRTGNLWIATNGGMQVYNPRLDLFSNYTKEGNKIKTNKVTSLYYAKGNKMLIGTAEGLCVMNISTSEMENLTGNSTNVSKFTNSYITQVFEDSRGLYWIGTREGVNVLNTITDVLNQLTEKQGLCNNNICGIAEDKNGNVWLTTSNGVCRVVVQRNPDENYNYGLYNYNTNDGLQGEEFNSGAIITLSDGNVAMGGPFGMNVIRRSTIIEKGELPPVVLTQLFIKEEEILVGHKYDGRVVLPVALNESSRIVLSNDQNTITIKFAAGSYNQSERLQFSYQLEGYRDKEWRNGDAAKHGVTFNDLPWGTYKLHVKAISAEGNVSGKERIIEIEIETPWYLQIWMLVIYALVIIALIYVWKKGYDQMRAMWKRKKTIINELSYMREEIKLASDELKQPMSRMTSIIMNLAERNESLEGREQLNNLHAQMLEVITRVSDMQSALEHPEESTKKKVDSNYLLEGKGELELPNLLEDELASAIKPHYAELPTSKFRVIFIDNNEDFVRFITSKLMHIYDFHPYADAQKAADDIESMQPDLVVCKHNMPNLTGSELCDHIKMHPKLSRIKFVLMTDTKLSSKDMMQENITMGADDYLAKPFNLQEAITRFNKLLGIGPLEMNTALIEGAETRMLENINSSMTTATESIDWTKQRNMTEVAINDEYIETVTMRPVKKRGELQTTDQNVSVSGSSENYSMADSMDQKLLNSIEQYVQQNMGRGTIDLEKMAEAMRMGMKPFFEKVKDITGKTPAEVVRDIRLKYACVLLQRTNINMSELASHVGFATGEHFINIFKDRFGISPSEYRQKYRK